MTFARVRSNLWEFAIALAISFVLFAGCTAVFRGDVRYFVEGSLLFFFAAVGPLIAVVAFWYAVPLLVVFAGLGFLATLKIEARVIRIAALVVLVLLWLIYGIRCFTAVTGGA